MVIPKQARRASNRANNEFEHFYVRGKMSNFTEETAQIRVLAYFYEIIIRSDDLE